MREQMELNKIHTKHLEGSIHHLEEEYLEKWFVELERKELETQKKELLLEKKLEEISKLLKIKTHMRFYFFNLLTYLTAKLFYG